MFSMELTVYNWEIFERSPFRYIRFSIVFIVIITISIIYKNAPWVIILLFFMWWYFYYSSTSNKKTSIKITESWLLILDKIYPWISFNWYILEVNRHDWEIKNIVFLSTKTHRIYTISDNLDNLKIFIENLEQYIKMLPWYEQTLLEKMMRKFQI